MLNKISRVPRETKPYLFTLPEDGPLAVSDGEIMHDFRSKLKSAMSAADRALQSEGLSPSAIFDDAQEIAAPFVEIYRNVDLLQRISSQFLDASARLELDSLLAYVTNAVQHDYEAADEQFSHGYVTKSHFNKLIRQNEIIIQVVDGEEIALMCERYELREPPSFELQCWSWHFGVCFRKERSVVQLIWPELHSNKIPISTLSAWPLRYADPELKTKLKERGIMLWQCRHRKLISYLAPAPAFEVQMVRGTLTPFGRAWR